MSVEETKRYYDENSIKEWERFDRHPFEFVFTTHIMDKYIKTSDSILDIGGGPGRYSINYAQKGCDVTLIDLSDGNIELAKVKAKEHRVDFPMFVANCLDIGAMDLGMYDHVFLMGPLYHLLNKEDRIQAVKLSIERLKPGGILYCSFILDFAGIIYDLKNGPGFLINDLGNQSTKELINSIVTATEYVGPAFTSAYFMNQRQIEPFMQQFNLEKLHLFGQEGILALNENQIKLFPKEEYELWIETAKRFLDIPEFLAFSEHAMYVGKKQFNNSLI
ncbi:MAG: class I SAM-dependent methyltransferase [Clostridiaceae bacterium]|jgi:2-polyprenyl-3-methyl-5-hydroxy-6-metoxy-1,4-benzoquinol methylase|nr:class I SAM-dependent methyltransferase [Clostridiaceae bacterium]